MNDQKHIRDVIALAACDTAFAAQVIITALEKAGYVIVKKDEIDRLRATAPAKPEKESAVR